VARSMAGFPKIPVNSQSRRSKSDSSLLIMS
jgi:hypothetical protein